MTGAPIFSRWLVTPTRKMSARLLVNCPGRDLEFFVPDAADDVGLLLFVPELTVRLPVKNAKFPRLKQSDSTGNPARRRASPSRKLGKH